mgnify:FL=1
MIHFIRTNSENKNFTELVECLDIDLAERDGEDHSFYAQFNKIQQIKNVVVAFDNQLPIACGAIKNYDSTTFEIKRMYTAPAHRGKGVAAKILSELEKWAIELGYKKCILETGKKQPEALHLYKKCGYVKINNYGQYAGIENSICFEKKLKL